MLWLTEQGCDVVGVEFCPQAVAEFFNEHQIPHEKTDSAYVATDRKLKVYYGDVLQLMVYYGDVVQIIVYVDVFQIIVYYGDVFQLMVYYGNATDGVLW